MPETQPIIAMTETLRQKVDEIGALKACIAPLLEQLKQQETYLKGFGPGRYVGRRYESNIYEQERATLDMAAVRAHLSRQFIAAHTNVAEVTIIKTTARQLNDDSISESVERAQ